MASATNLPAKFGRYRIVKHLGRGGMGNVFLAHDENAGRRVALKVAHSAGAGSEAFERFLREARLAASLAHPNLCSVLDSGEVDGRYYLAMAYIEGRSLADVLRQEGAMAPRRAALLVRTIAQALQAAHRQGIIHRDLKPANIMIDQCGEPIVMDFGLARRDQDTRATLSGQALGTPTYMPPEQIMGDLDGMGPCSDVYSLGVILYEMLTGQPPFRGNLSAIMLQVLRKDPDTLSQVRPGIDPRLESLCLKAMARTPADRYQSMTEIAAALSNYLDGKGVLSPEAPPASSPRQRWRVPIWLWSIGVGGIAAGLLAAVLWMQTNRSTLRIETDDPSITVLIDGEEFPLSDREGSVDLRVGKHQLVVKRGDQEVERREFMVRRGKNKALRVPSSKTGIGAGS